MHNHINIMMAWITGYTALYNFLLTPFSPPTHPPSSLWCKNYAGVSWRDGFHSLSENSWPLPSPMATMSSGCSMLSRQSVSTWLQELTTHCTTDLSLFHIMNFILYIPWIVLFNRYTYLHVHVPMCMEWCKRHTCNPSISLNQYNIAQACPTDALHHTSS